MLRYKKQNNLYIQVLCFYTITKAGISIFPQIFEIVIPWIQYLYWIASNCFTQTVDVCECVYLQAKNFTIGNNIVQSIMYKKYLH